MINNDKGSIEIYQAQEGARNHSMPSLVQPKKACQPRNTGINTTSSGYNGHEATTSSSVPHLITTPNRNNNSRNVNQDSVIVCNNVSPSNTLENMREEVTGMIGLNKLSDFKFVSTPIQKGGINAKTNGHNHSNAKIDLTSRSTATRRQVGAQSSSMTSTSCTVDNYAKGHSENISDSLKYHLPTETAQLLNFVQTFSALSRQFQNESKASKLNPLNSKVRTQNQGRQSIIKSGRKSNYPTSIPQKSSASHKVSTTGSWNPSELYNMISVPGTSGGKTLHQTPAAQHVPRTSSITEDLGIPSLPLAKAPIRPEQSSYAKVPSREEGADSLPKIVSLYSLNNKSMPKPEKSQKTKNRRNRNKTANSDPTLSSNSTTHTITTVNRAQVELNPNSHFTHTVSKKKNYKEIKNAGTNQQQNFEISSSSLDAWFKSTQSSALEMQVLKSSPEYSNASSTNTNTKTSVTTIQEINPFKPQIEKNKSHDSSKVFGKSNPLSCQTSKSITQELNNRKGKESKTKNRLVSVNAKRPHDTILKSVEKSRSQLTALPGNINRNLQTKPNPSVSCTSELLTSETTSIPCSEEPLDYSMKTLNKTFKKEDGLQSQPLDLTVSKIQTKPSHLIEADNIKHLPSDAWHNNVGTSNINEFGSEVPKHDLIMKAIDRVISMSQAHASFTDRENLNDCTAVAKYDISSIDTTQNLSSSSVTTSVTQIDSISSVKNASPSFDSTKSFPDIGATIIPISYLSASSHSSTIDALSCNSSESPLGKVVSDKIKINNASQVNVVTASHTSEELTTDVCSREMRVKDNSLIGKLSSDRRKPLQNTTFNTGKVKTPVENKISQQSTVEVEDAPEQSVHDVDIEVINDNSNVNEDEGNEKQENPSQLQHQETNNESIMITDSPDIEVLATSDILKINRKENVMQENLHQIAGISSKRHGDEFHRKQAEQNESKKGKENEMQANLTASTDVNDKAETYGTNSENIGSTSDMKSLASTKNKSPISSQLVVKVRKISDGQFQIINAAGEQQGEKIDNNFKKLDPVEVIKSDEVQKATPGVDVSIDDFDIITLIPHVPKPGPDIMVLEEACCDEYDNMHFNEELEFSENVHPEMYPDSPIPPNETDDHDIHEKENIAVESKNREMFREKASESPGSPDQTTKVKTKVIHVRNYSQDAFSVEHEKLEHHPTNNLPNLLNDASKKGKSEVKSSKTVRTKFFGENGAQSQYSSPSKPVKANGDLSQAQIVLSQPGDNFPVKAEVADIHDNLLVVPESLNKSFSSIEDESLLFQVCETTKLSPINSKVADIYNDIPTVKEEIFDYTSPLKRKSSIKLGYNVNVGIKSPELMRKRRKLIAKNIKPVVKVRKSKSFSIILSDSEESSDEGEEVFKTPKFKKSNMKRKLTQSQNITTPSEINMEITQTCEPTIEVKPFIPPEKPAEVLFQSSSSDDNTDLDENLKNIVDNIISSTSEKQTSEPVKRKKVDKEPPEKAKKNSARLGNWRPTEFPVMKNIQIKSLPYYNKSKIMEEHIGTFKNWMILQNLMKMGVLTNESTEMKQGKVSEFTIRSDYNGSLLYIPEGIKLKLCFVRLEKLDL